ncbi:MAG: DMT family transporter [Pseudomonadota bacterium]
MRLFLLTTLTMCAFAANSLLNRVAVESQSIDPSSFAFIRVLSGAAVLGLIVVFRGGGLQPFRRVRLIGALSLSAYMIGFSLAYITLDAGLGALILFGTVQIGMFLWSALTGSRPTARQMAGAGIAFGGLMLALWPEDGGATGLGGARFMVIAGLGWAAYTLSGRGAADPIAATAANFILALPVMLLFLPAFSPVGDFNGIALAVISGAVTSGLGYALWYRILPDHTPQAAAVIQLCVPVIAILGGAVLLGENVTPVLSLAAALVVGGIALAVTSRSVPARRS